jgi:hypothetical protein
MNPRPRFVAAAFALIVASGWPCAVFAAEISCPGVTLAPDAAFLGRSRELLERIQREFEARADVDACARVELSVAWGEAEDAVFEVSVALPDGRAVSRRVARDEDVIPTLQALLLVPDRTLLPPPVHAAPSTPPAAVLTRRSAAPDTSSDTPAHHAASEAAGARDLGIELTVLTGARVGDGQWGVGLGARSYLEVKGWLIGFTGRVDSYQTWNEGDAQTALELGLLTGWRLAWDSVALDLTAGPAVAIKGLVGSYSEVRSVNASNPDNGPPPPDAAELSSGPVPRLLVNVCLGFAPRSIVRTFVGIGAEFGPAQAADSASSTRMPEYTVGLALGATVGTR